MAKKEAPAPKKKAATPKAPALYKGPFCPTCQGPVDISVRSGDEGIPKERCMNESCADYGVPREVPRA